MAKICYTPRKFSAESLRLIEICNGVISRYSSKGQTASTRQLYYQLVGINAIRNNLKSYGIVQGLLNNARLAGLVDWNAIEDRSRQLESIHHDKHPRDVVTRAADGFHFWKWEDQPNYVEVWVEKDALKGIVGAVCDPMDVPFFSTRGYSSVSEIYAASVRFREELAHGKEIHIIQLSDHDPSGIDMTRDIEERLNRVFGTPCHIHRVALNMSQVEEYRLPENPAKMSDSRAEAYVEEFGVSSYELDALDLDVLAAIVRSNVLQFRDEALWLAAVEREKRARLLFKQFHNRWGEIVRLMREEPEV